MVIDFHTHIYPDKIAKRTIEALTASAPGVNVYTEGTTSALLNSMAEAGIDKSVVLPVATRKGQFDTINRFAAQLNQTYPQLISFGAIHPDDDDIPAKIQFLKDSGFKGIKIHPDYTGTFIDDERYIRIITEAARKELVVVTHAGADPAFNEIHCPPARARAVMDKVFNETGIQKPFMVFAHLGGIYVHKEAMQYLIGTNCYIDISCSFSSLGSWCDTDNAEVVEVIRKHGANKILFATDSPWNHQKAYLDHFRHLSDLNDTEKDLILYKNAAKILQIS